MSHTREPWSDDGQEVYGYDHRGKWSRILIAYSSHESYSIDTAEANARRIVACVNACAGIDTETLEQFHQTQDNRILATTIVNQREELRKIEAQHSDLQALCRELVDALKDIRSYHSVMPDNVTNKSRIMATKADTAISKTEGKL